MSTDFYVIYKPYQSSKQSLNLSGNWSPTDALCLGLMAIIEIIKPQY